MFRVSMESKTGQRQGEPGNDEEWESGVEEVGKRKKRQRSWGYNIVTLTKQVCGLPKAQPLFHIRSITGSFHAYSFSSLLFFFSRHIFPVTKPFSAPRICQNKTALRSKVYLCKAASRRWKCSVRPPRRNQKGCGAGMLNESQESNVPVGSQ